MTYCFKQYIMMMVLLVKLVSSLNMLVSKVNFAGSKAANSLATVMTGSIGDYQKPQAV